jgi:preprotein translocase subunit SecB
MTDQPVGGPKEDAPKDTPKPPALSVLAQYVKDLSFENPNAPQSLMNLKRAPDVNVNIDVTANQLPDQSFEVTLTTRAEGSASGAPLFIAEVQYAGIFTIGDVPKEYVQPLMMIEAPRLLFPYARAIMSSCVRDGGFPPLMIHPIDFVALYQSRVAQAQAAMKVGANLGGEATREADDSGAGKGGKAGGEKFEFEL